MASNVDLCNRALIRLGHAPIQSLNESSQEAFYCRTFFDEARRATLRAHPWNFATDIKPLAPLSEVPYGYNYAYTLPADCLRPLEIMGAVPDAGEPIVFEIRKDRKLVTNQPDAVLRYIADVTNSAFFDAEFEVAFVYRLASDLAAPITGNAALAQSMLGFFNQYLASAQATDANEGKADPLFGRSFLNARR